MHFAAKAFMDESGTGSLTATVKEKSFAGGQLRMLLELPDGSEITASRYGIDANVKIGQKVGWSFEPGDGVIVDREDQDEQL